jgi:hypothetical protein
MDVFKYLKKVNTYLSEAAAEDARKIGLEYAGYGKWRDPKTGLVTHKSTKLGGGQTKLDKLVKPEEPKTKEPQQSQEQPQGQTLSQFQQTASSRMDLSQVPTDGVDPEKDAEMRAMSASQGMWPHYSDERKAYHIQRQKDAAAAAETEMIADSEPEEQPQEVDQQQVPEEEPVKEPEDFRTIDDVVTEIQGTEFRSQPGFTDELPSNTEQYLKKVEKNDYGNGVDYVDLREYVDTDSIGVPSKYFDVLSRALITKNIKGETDNWSHYGEGLAGGAGQINSQMGELMTLIFASSSPEDRKNLSEIIRSQVKSAEEQGSVKKDLTITEDWIDASLDNASAIDRYMQLEAPNSEIVGGSWDQPDELQSLGIGEGGEEKGFSTDIVIRDSNGKNHQLSLKKDGNVNFLNSGAGQYTKFYLAGALEDESNPYHETAKKYFEDIDRVNEIFNELGIEEYDGEALPNIPNQKKLKELGVSDPKKVNKELTELRNSLNEVRRNEDIVPKEYNLSEYNRQENNALRENFSKLGSEIRDLNIDDINTPATELFTEYFEDGNFSDDIKGRFFNSDGTLRVDSKTGNISPATPTKSMDKGEYQRAKNLVSDANKDAKAGEIKGKIESIMKKENIKDWPTFVDKLENGDIKLSARERNKIMLNAILATKTDVARKHRDDMKQRERDFVKNSINAISQDPVMKAGTLSSLRKNFPLKDVSEGSESMIIGDSVFSKSVLEKMFGTKDFNQIKDRLTVEKDSNGNPFLGYSAEIDTNGDGDFDNILPISDINVRADGLGYGQTIKHEMKLRKDFYKRLQDLNEEMGTNLTEEDIMFIVFGRQRSAKQIHESLRSVLKDPFSY